MSDLNEPGAPGLSEPASPQPATPSAPKDPAPRKLPSAKTVVGWLGSAAVPASIICYVLGFMVAVPFLTGAGVPIRSLAPQTFLAAGLLAGIGLLPFPLMIYWYAGRERPQTAAQRWSARALVGLAPFLLTLRLGPSVEWALAFNISAWIVIVGAWSYYDTSGDFLPSAAMNLGVLAVLVGTICGTFGTIVYPRVRLAWGGGQPAPILSITVNGTQDAPMIERDKWAAIGCRTEPTVTPRCRTIYRAYEDEAYLFVGIIEVAGACPATPRPWGDWPLWGTSKKIGGCYQRISHSEIPRLEISARP